MFYSSLVLSHVTPKIYLNKPVELNRKNQNFNQQKLFLPGTTPKVMYQLIKTKPKKLLPLWIMFE